MKMYGTNALKYNYERQARRIIKTIKLRTQNYHEQPYKMTVILDSMRTCSAVINLQQNRDKMLPDYTKKIKALRFARFARISY